MIGALERIWYGGAVGALNLAGLLLVPLGLLWCAIARIRLACYRQGLVPSVHPGVPVIVIGNLTVGGTGKTPLVLWMAQFLRARGWSPGVVLRGYGGRSCHPSRVVTPDTSPDECGDEAVVIARHAGCPVVADPDRVRGALALKALGCDVVLSDDGLQHLALRRDIEIVVLDGMRRLGNGRCLPAGPLREPVSRLTQVTARITHGVPRAGEYGMHLRPESWCRVDGAGAPLPPAAFSGARAHAVAGIGNPGRFFRSLEALGIHAIPHAFPDHHRFSAGDLAFPGDDPILMTEKDAVKCTRFADGRHWYLGVRAEPDEAFQNLLLTQLSAVSGPGPTTG